MAAEAQAANIWAPSPCETAEELQAAMAQLQNMDASELPAAPALPELPLYSPVASPEEWLRQVQQCIEQFEYNHTGEKWFTLRKDRGISGVLSMGRRIWDKALPIQCIEAVFIAVFLTQNAPGFPGCDVFPDDMLRLTLRFKSCVASNPKQTHRHIVLAVRTPQGKWGALGISRRSNLQDKPCVHASLSELVLEFALSYREVGHVLRKVYVGLPLPQGGANHTALQWRAGALRLPLRLLPPAEAPLGGGARAAWAEAGGALRRFEEALPALQSAWSSRGRITPQQRRAHRFSAAALQDALGAPTVADGSSSDEEDLSAADDDKLAADKSGPEAREFAEDAQLQLTLGGV